MTLACNGIALLSYVGVILICFMVSYGLVYLMGVVCVA